MSNLIRTDEHIAINRAFGTQELNDILAKAMERESKWTQKESFAPSGLGYSGQCPRYWYYAFNGAMFEYTTEPMAMANMEAGTDAGKRIAKVFDKAGLLISDELPIRHDDPPIFGYMDMLIEWKGEEVPVEVKTTKDSTWNYRALNHMVPNYQMIQLLIYMHITEHSKGFFLTENKNTHEIFILPVKMTPERQQFVESTFDWMREVRHNALHGELPKRPFTKSSLECKGCAVRNTCWDGWTRGKVNGTDPNPGTVDLGVLNIPK